MHLDNETVKFSLDLQRKKYGAEWLTWLTFSHTHKHTHTHTHTYTLTEYYIYQV